MPTAVIVGASTGIGLALAQRLVAASWSVIGLARREAGFAHAAYRHIVADVSAATFRDALVALDTPDLVVYSAGIGHPFDPTSMHHDAETFAINLTGCAITAEVFIPRMIAAKRGQFIGLSSLADRFIDSFSPSYNASKAGMSSYLEGLALACRPHGVAVTNIRLGFVDTAMSSTATARPFMVTADRAAQVIERCMTTRPMRRTFPLRMAATMWLLRWINRFRIWIS